MITIQAGYRCYTGKILGKHEAEALNRAYAERDRYAALYSEAPINSERWQSLERMRDHCHMLFVLLAELEQ